MDNLKKLLFRCNEMDITEQILTFNDPFLPSNAQKELDALLAENEALKSENERLADQLETCRASLDSLVDGLR